MVNFSKIPSSGHMALAATFFSLMGIVVKSLQDVPTHQIVFFRGVITVFYCLIFLKAKNVSPWGINKKVLLIRGLAGSLALYLFFHTLKVLPLSDATAIQKLSPLFVVFLAAFIHKTKIKPIQLLIFLIAILGVFFLKGFSFGEQTSSYFMALAASLLAGVAYTCINILKESEHPLVIMFYFPLITLTLISPYSLTHWAPLTLKHWILLLLMGTFIQIAQYFVTLAYQRGDPGKIGPVYYLEIVLGCIWGVTLFSERLSITQVVGIGMIISALLLNYNNKK